MRKRLFYDIETSFNVGVFWRTGYNLTINPGDIIHERAIICICYKWEGEDEIHSLTWSKSQSDKHMLKEFCNILAKADEIVAHNGDRFDLKWIRTRALIHGISVMPSPKSIDTLKWAKKYFNFNSNKLDYIAKFLNVGAKMDTGGLDLWKDIVFRKDQQALDKMVKYCKMDVEVLESVFNKLNAYTLANHNYAVQHGGDKYECPECGGINVKYNKKVVTTAGTVHHWILCKDCKKHYKINHLVFTKYQEYLYKRKSIA
jgi:predicted PolB exonuclease-like 3'-5' exonuclease